MSVILSSNRYGKSRVRLVKVERNGTSHDVRDLTVGIQLEGSFEASYIEGDNSSVIATDTMKNMVYVLARQAPIGDIEQFSHRLANHFLDRYSQVDRAFVNVSEARWRRIETHGRTDHYSFTGGSSERRTARITATRGSTARWSGLDDLIVLKTAKSGFEGYTQDEYTTLKETKDRLFGTAIQAEWIYQGEEISYNTFWQGIRQTLLDVFAVHESKGVQHTLYAMGELVLEQFQNVSEIRLTMPNRHCLLVDLSPFELNNPNEVFVPVEEPHGLIEAVLKRSAS